jgi:hypothetical protein
MTPEELRAAAKAAREAHDAIADQVAPVVARLNEGRGHAPYWEALGSLGHLERWLTSYADAQEGVPGFDAESEPLPGAIGSRR